MVKALFDEIPFQESVSNAATAGVASLLSAAADYIPHDREVMSGLFSTRVVVAETAASRAKWVLNRWYTRGTGEDPKDIPLSGGLFLQILHLIGIGKKGRIDRQGMYLLRIAENKAARGS